jgi:hypothetical protein
MKLKKPAGMSIAVFAAVLVWTASEGFGASTKELLETIKQVDRAGQGNEAAATALRELTAQDAEVLPQILDAFQGQLAQGRV